MYVTFRFIFPMEFLHKQLYRHLFQLQKRNKFMPIDMNSALSYKNRILFNFS